ncbi:unnamed protein product [Closterium sp. NIES-53]
MAATPLLLRSIFIAGEGRSDVALLVCPGGGLARYSVCECSEPAVKSILLCVSSIHVSLTPVSYVSLSSPLLFTAMPDPVSCDFVSTKTKGVSPSPYTGSFQVSVKMTEFTQLVGYTLRVFALPHNPQPTFSDVGIFKGKEGAKGTSVTSFPCRMLPVGTGWVCYGEARTTLDKSWTPKLKAADLLKAGVYDTPVNFYVNVTYSGATTASGGSSGTIRGQLVG